MYIAAHVRDEMGRDVTIDSRREKLKAEGKRKERGKSTYSPGELSCETSNQYPSIPCVKMSRMA